MGWGRGTRSLPARPSGNDAAWPPKTKMLFPAPAIPDHRRGEGLKGSGVLSETSVQASVLMSNDHTLLNIFPPAHVRTLASMYDVTIILTDPSMAKQKPVPFAEKCSASARRANSLVSSPPKTHSLLFK
eukprot:3938405-Rhodomonas_salina.2